ncbi:hypothetical protein J2T57_001277 [Natronocella acetinitrilica]|uniref:Uncharacterized protein n=1 Tax=Natronocella acetinitrilica TaxID=414046 RepID=A0AAE3G1Y3_9GAMM|nr:hypothetical protein [Natronocella acetinitrilica]MCP1674175.1 hypothetical protein [Natronocella acetinitrilica]
MSSDEGGINLVLYPREYNRRGEEHLHSVRGVTQDGREVNVKLRIAKSLRDEAKAPRIAEFARTDRRAKSACLASADNGPERREGVLLFSRAIPEGAGRRGVQDYVARWAVVLAEDAESPDPVFGLGRLEVVRDASRARAGGSALSPAAASALESDPRSYLYPAIVYHVEATARLPGGSPEAAETAIAALMEARTAAGIAGGALIRCINADGVCVGEPSEIFVRFARGSNGYESGAARVRAHLAEERPVWARAREGELLVTPLSRIYHGAAGGSYFGSSARYQSLTRAFFDAAGDPQLCRVAIRVKHYADSGVTQLYRLYPLSPPLGGPGQLDGDGGFTLPGAADALKPAFSPPGAADWIERPLVRLGGLPPARAAWLLDAARDPSDRAPTAQGADGVPESVPQAPHAGEPEALAQAAVADDSPPATAPGAAEAGLDANVTGRDGEDGLSVGRDADAHGVLSQDPGGLHGSSPETDSETDSGRQPPSEGAPDKQAADLTAPAEADTPQAESAPAQLSGLAAFMKRNRQG